MPRFKAVPEQAIDIIISWGKAVAGRIVYVPGLRGRNNKPFWLMRQDDGRWFQASEYDIACAAQAWIDAQLENTLISNQTVKQLQMRGTRETLVSSLRYSPRTKAHSGTRSVGATKVDMRASGLDS
jgi:hypothetical protein